MRAIIDLPYVGKIFSLLFFGSFHPHHLSVTAARGYATSPVVRGLGLIAHFSYRFSQSKSVSKSHGSHSGGSWRRKATERAVKTKHIKKPTNFMFVGFLF
jgi:hypothetical protein